MSLAFPFARTITVDVILGSALALLLSVAATGSAALGGEKAVSGPIQLKTSQACLLVDSKGHVALKPNNPACPAPASFQTPLWVLTLSQGTDAFRLGRPLTITQSVPSQVSPVADGVRLFYDKIGHDEKTFDIQLDLTITVVGDEFRFGGTMVNNTKDRVVTEWKYPIFLGIEAQRDAQQHATPAVLWPDGLGRRFLTQESFGSHRTFTYPGGRGTMQWLAFTHDETGLYFGCHDKKSNAKTFAAAHTRGVGYDVSLKHLPYCVPGEQWEGPPTVVMPYAGPWHVASRHYREWVESWLDRLPKPQWAQDSTGWLLAILKQQNGDLMWDYGSLDRLAELADERGLDTLGLFGWAHGGHDRYYPDYIPDPKMGGPETLKASIKKVQQLGKRVILYANGQLIDSSTEFYRLHGVETMIADPRGNPAIQMYNKFKATSTPIFVTACTAAPLWRQRLLSLAEQAHSLGADGILFDQLGILGPKQCFNKDHGHKTPAASEGRLELIRGIARHMRKLDPEFIIMTEGVFDVEQSDIPYFHGCGTGFGYYEPGASGTVFPELFRYTFPTFVATQRIPNPFLTRNFANYACAYGLRFEIESRYTADVKYLTTDQVPAPEEYADCNSPPNVELLQTVSCKESARYMRDVATFRMQHADLLLRGRFIDADGIVVEGGDIVAKAFQSDNQIGVIVWNATEEPQTAKITVAGHAFFAAYAPETPRTVDCDAAIPPESIRLFVWNRQ